MAAHKRAFALLASSPLGGDRLRDEGALDARELRGPGRFGRAAWASGLVLLLALVLVVSHVGEGPRLVELLLHAFAEHPFWLLAAIALQAGTYVCAAGVWQRALDASREPRRLRDLVPLGLAKLFADQALPSAGLSGTLLVVRALHGRGVPRGVAIGAMVTGLVSFYAAYGLARAIDLLGLHREKRSWKAHPVPAQRGATPPTEGTAR